LGTSGLKPFIVSVVIAALKRCFSLKSSRSQSPARV
jgi:hypothetical protein